MTNAQKIRILGENMCYVITDLVLEDLPGFKTSVKRRGEWEDTIIEYGCVRLLKADPVRLSGYRHGFDDFNDLFNSLMHTAGIEWHVYISAMYSINEKSLLLLFVYEYLNRGNHIVLYTQAGAPHFHPELPISSVDVTSKGMGHTPADYPMTYGDYAYHFFKSGPYVFKHDTNCC